MDVVELVINIPSKNKVILKAPKSLDIMSCVNYLFIFKSFKLQGDVIIYKNGKKCSSDDLYQSLEIMGVDPKTYFTVFSQNTVNCQHSFEMCEKDISHFRETVTKVTMIDYFINCDGSWVVLNSDNDNENSDDGKDEFEILTVHCCDDCYHKKCNKGVSKEDMLLCEEKCMCEVNIHI